MSLWLPRCRSGVGFFLFPSSASERGSSSSNGIRRLPTLIFFVPIVAGTGNVGGVADDVGKAEVGGVSPDGRAEVGAVPDDGKAKVGAVADDGKAAVGAVADDGKAAVGAVADDGKAAVGAVADDGKAKVGAIADDGKADVGIIADDIAKADRSLAILTLPFRFGRVVFGESAGAVAVAVTDVNAGAGVIEDLVCPGAVAVSIAVSVAVSVAFL